DPQVLHLRATERTARDHALDRLDDDALGKAAFEALAEGLALDPAGMTGVIVEDLTLGLAAGQADLLGVDDDDGVAAMDVRRERGLVLAAEPHGDDRGEPAEHQPVGVDQHPLLLHVGSLHTGGAVTKGLHGSFFRERALMTASPRDVKSGEICTVFQYLK